MMMRQRGFTVAELLVSLVIGAIVILTVIAMGQAAVTSYAQLRSRIGMYEDVQSALDLVIGAVRRGSLATVSGGCLTVGTNNFYAYGGNKFLYGTGACGNASNTNTAVITGVTGLTFNPSVTGKLVLLPFSVTINNQTFSISGSAMERN